MTESSHLQETLWTWLELASEELRLLWPELRLRIAGHPREAGLDPFRRFVVSR